MFLTCRTPTSGCALSSSPSRPTSTRTSPSLVFPASPPSRRPKLPHGSSRADRTSRSTTTRSSQARPMTGVRVHTFAPCVLHLTPVAAVCIAAGGYSSDLPISLDAVREYAAAAIGAPGVKRPVPDWYFGLLDLLEPVADEATVFMAKCSTSHHRKACCNCPNHRFAVSSSKVYYEQAADSLPRNFVAIGDSTLRLNPRAGCAYIPQYPNPRQTNHCVYAARVSASARLAP